MYIRIHFSVSSLPNVGPKQLCVLAHLGCTHEAGTSWSKINAARCERRCMYALQIMHYMKVYVSLGHSSMTLKIQKKKC